MRLELARDLKETPEAIAVICKTLLNDSPSKVILSKAVNALPEYSEEFEAIAMQRIPNEYFSFLEESKRLNDCVRFLAEYRNKLYDIEKKEFGFYKRHAQQFTRQAEYFFVREIEKNLTQTGEHFYRAIVDALQSLLKINDEKAGEIYQMLKTTYKRRTTLMTMIDKVFMKSQERPKNLLNRN